MPVDPYAPPRPAQDAPLAVAPLPPELETRALRALGELRVRAATWSFVIGWLASTVVLMLIGLGLIPAGVVGAVAGGAISKGYVNLRKPAMIDAVCRELGIPTGHFRPDQYLIG